jgi:hypothetical protein
MMRFLNLFNLLRSAFAKYKWQIVVTAVLNFFSSLLEGIGINAIIPVFSLIYGNQNYLFCSWYDNRQ